MHIYIHITIYIGNFEKAIEYYTYATEIDPKNHLYYTNRS